MSINWRQQITDAVGVARLYGWKVVFKPKAQDIIIDKEKTIRLNSNSNPRRMFYVFLHELGHMLLFAQPNYDEKYGIYKGRGKYSTLKYRIAIVEEEIDAWNQGKELAIQQGWQLDNHYEVVKANKLSSYMLWAMSIKHPHPDFSGRRFDTSSNKPKIASLKDCSTTDANTTINQTDHTDKET